MVRERQLSVVAGTDTPAGSTIRHGLPPSPRGTGLPKPNSALRGRDGFVRRPRLVQRLHVANLEYLYSVMQAEQKASK